MLTRAASVSGSLDIEARTVEVIFASEQPVRRRNWDIGSYDEVLLCGRDNVDLSRADNMSLLDTHGAYSLDDRLGAVVPGSIRFEKGRIVATVKLSRRAKAEELLQDLQDGMSLPISVGYRIAQEERTEAPQGGVPTIKATRWMPMEISVVPIPADPTARTRELNEEDTMPETQTQTRAERKRINEIQALARTANIELDADVVATAVEEGHSLDQFRAAMLDHLIKEENRSPTFPHSTMRGMTDERDKTRSLVANAMMHRHGLTNKLEDGAGQYRDMGILDIARDLLHQRGENARGAPSEILERSLHTTSDFPIILNQIVSGSLMQAYSTYENTFQLIAHRNVVQDLREVKVLELGSGPELELVTEKGEYKRGTVKESQEGFTMAHYGKVFGLTEAMLINDQLGAFLKMIAAWGRMAAKLEGDIVWRVITENQKLKSDGKALFHADHGNLAPTGTTLDEPNLIAARTAFRKQKDIDGEPINISPRFLFVGSDLEIPAQKLTQGVIVPTKADDVVPQAIRSMTPVYESRLDKISTKAWFLFADAVSTMGRGLQYSHLSGYEAPRMKERWGFDYDGVEYRLDHYFGAGLTDFRFGYKNPGN